MSTRQSAGWIAGLAILLASVPMLSHGETVKLKATADIGVSSVVYKGINERQLSWGLHSRVKLKSIQEMGVFRFDATPIVGKEVKGARLFLNCTGENQLRYLRVSTVNNDWEEGTQEKAYGPPNGACFDYADWDSKRPWSWPGSQLCDVTLGAGNTIHHWGERKELKDGWISLEIPPALVYAMAVKDTDGLAVQDGGTIDYFNNWINSVQSMKPPYIEVDVAGEMNVAPDAPKAKATPNPGRAGLGTGAVKLTIQPSKGVFCWRIKLNGKPVPRWRVPHPGADGSADFVIDELPPGKECALEIVAVAASGIASAPVSVTTKSSVALSIPVKLGKLKAPAGTVAKKDGFSVWPCPGLVKIDPLSTTAMYKDMNGKGDGKAPNAVWDGKKIGLFGCRGEYVSFQLVIDLPADKTLTGVAITPESLKNGNGATIDAVANIELYKNWYAQNKDKKWQPAYCVPLGHGEALQIPDPTRKLENQQNQSIYVDLYIPKKAKPGQYNGSIAVKADGQQDAKFPLEIEVFDFDMPDKLAFWPQLNCYRLPKGAGTLDTYRLAHQHRNVFFLRNFRPQLQGKGKNMKVVWDRYDKAVDPLLSGKAFAGNRRANTPLEALGLPFIDSWPTNLSKATYKYDGDWTRTSTKDRNQLKELRKRVILPHYMNAPYIGNALTQEYKDAFKAVQRQFIEHFKEKGWSQTESQCLFMGKNTHRIHYRVNMWWTTDEPYHWDDWLALQFFGRMWKKGLSREQSKLWAFRADISRPQWQACVLDDAADNIHFGTGAFSSAPMYRRCRTMARRAGFDVRSYGSANGDNRSNTESVVLILNAWLNGSRALLPWQAMGNDKALDVNDSAVGGNALIAPGTRFGKKPVADIRLKAFRDGEQVVEYLLLLSKRYNLNRDQLKAIVFDSIKMEGGVAKGAGADNADALRFNALKAWEIAGLRRGLARLIQGKQVSEATR